MESEAGAAAEDERCQQCPLSKLEEIDTGPLGDTVRRGVRVRQLSEMVSLRPNDILADELAVIALLKEEQPQPSPNAIEYPNAGRNGRHPAW